MVTPERLFVKLVKLNRRHKAYKDLGHRWAFRWDSYDTKNCAKVENIFYAMHGSQYRASCLWKSNFGHANRGNVYRPYWISFVNEADASLVLLQIQH